MRREAFVALALAACASPRDTSDEVKRRDEFARAVARDAGARGVELANAPDIRFEAGFSDIVFDEDLEQRCWPSLPELQCARRWQFMGYRKNPFRWLGPHALLRLRSHGARPMRFSAHGWVDQQAIYTTPYVAVYVDGRPMATADVIAADGSFSVSAEVDAAALAKHDWVVLTLDLSSVGWHWLDVRDLRIAVVDRVEWTEAAP